MKVNFKSELVVKVLDRGDYQVERPFDVEIVEPNRVRYLSVPHGFTTDFESIPRVLIPAYALMKGKARKSAVLHDWLYWTREDREWADKVFLTAMRQETNWLYRHAMWAAVRLFGGMQYAKRDCTKCEAHDESDDPGRIGG